MQQHPGRPGAPRDDWNRFIREAEHEAWDAKVRRCVRCGLEKDYRPRKDRPGGQPYCKGCMHAYWQVWRRRRRDAAIAARKATIAAGWR
jgi:hypothetical protein